MTIKLPESKVYSQDELREQYVAQHKEFSQQVEAAIQALIAHHRLNYEERIFNMWHDDIQSFIDDREPNETPYDHVAIAKREPKARTDYEAKCLAEERMAYLSLYTTFPKLGSLSEDGAGDRLNQRRIARPGIDFTEYGEWLKWLENPERAAFSVEFVPTAEVDLRRRAREYVDNVCKVFVHKTVDKVIDVLVAKGSRYECHLHTGHFNLDGFEGDIVIAFSDQTGFRTHVIVKDNISCLGNPYVQYPLTFHDVVSETGRDPVAMLSQDEVFNRFCVNRWKSPKRKKKPWTTVNVGDLVQTARLTICIILAVRGTTATVYHPSRGESKIEGTEIKAILARTRVNTWSSRESYRLRVEPHEGKEYMVKVPDTDMPRIREMPYGLRKDTEARKACLPEALRLWNSGQSE